MVGQHDGDFDVTDDGDLDEEYAGMVHTGLAGLEGLDDDADLGELSIEGVDGEVDTRLLWASSVWRLWQDVGESTASALAALAAYLEVSESPPGPPPDDRHDRHDPLGLSGSDERRDSDGDSDSDSDDEAEDMARSTMTMTVAARLSAQRVATAGLGLHRDTPALARTLRLGAAEDAVGPATRTAESLTRLQEQLPLLRREMKAALAQPMDATTDGGGHIEGTLFLELAGRVVKRLDRELPSIRAGMAGMDHGSNEAS
jgi:hypothetical protein